MRSLKIDGATGLLLCWCCGVSPAYAQESLEPPSGFTELFNGRDLENWVEIQLPAGDRDGSISPAKVTTPEKTPQNWRVDQGVLVGQGAGSNLSTTNSYENFELMVDWKSSPSEDGGISMRGATLATFAKFSKPAEDREITAPSASPLSEGWNRMWIRIVGPLVTVRLNGVETAINQPYGRYFEQSERMPLRGPIGLVAGKGETRFRNVFIREISFEEAAEVLATVGAGEDGFVSLFNGRDLEGWMGATNSYVVNDGAIECRPQGEGQLLTVERFSDFVVRLEFKLPPGGNSGLAIRTEPTDTDPAFQSFEIQVLDDTAEKYAALQKYQYHGSLYGLQPAIRGYLRPVGEWNYQETTVRGDAFQVKLNGFEILNVSLRDLPAEPLDHQQHPGLTRTEGHFGFCSHHDPVGFRNIRIKRLPSE